jgi:hypothetical protein
MRLPIQASRHRTAPSWSNSAPASISAWTRLKSGQKTLTGMSANKGLILTHPDHAEDIEEIYRTTMAALPDEPIPEGRAEIEALRRAANRAAAAGQVIALGDLT